MIKLNQNELKAYNDILNRIQTLPVGKYNAKDFFNGAPTCPRIVRRLFEDVKKGKIARIVLAGKKSADGYLIYNSVGNVKK